MSIDNIQKELTLLRRKRGVIKGFLTRIQNFIRDFNPRDQPLSFLESHQDELLQINKKFDDVQSLIDLISDEVEQEEEERNSFKCDYFNIRSQIQEIVNLEKLNNSSLHNMSMGTTGASHRARLAPISLPYFNSDIQEWASFFDCFCALVHNDDSFSPSQKFHYLRASLEDQALDMIKAIPMTEANYNMAIELLKQRYDNKSLVLQAHIRALIDSPRIEAVSAFELHRLHSYVSAHIAALKVIGQPVDQWDA